jgi:hypothetical protein
MVSVNPALKEELGQAASDAASHTAHKLAAALLSGQRTTSSSTGKSSKKPAAPTPTPLADLKRLAQELYHFADLSLSRFTAGQPVQEPVDAAATAALRAAYEDASPAQRLALLPLGGMLSSLGLELGPWADSAFRCLVAVPVCELRNDALLRETCSVINDVFCYGRDVATAWEFGDEETDFSEDLARLAALNAVLGWAGKDTLRAFMPVYAGFMVLVASVITHSAFDVFWNREEQKKAENR